MIQYTNIAHGSASEVQYELLLAKDLGYLSEDQYSILNGDIAHICAMLSKMRRALIKKEMAKK